MKTLLLDADGVVLKKEGYVSEKFARDYNVAVEDVMSFFTGPFVDCQSGTKDLKEELMPYLENWGWNDGVDAFLDYWFQDVVVDQEVLQEITRLREQGVQCYMASNNEHYRAKKIKEILGDALDGYFFSADLKVRKNDPDYFTKVSEMINVPVSNLLFLDNDEGNIEAAEEAGVTAKLYHPEVWSELRLTERSDEFKVR
jgi:putative hydrolase of the HAD superfamily